MGIKYGNNIDLGHNQLLNAALENLPSHPLNPVLGQTYYNTVLKTVFTCNDENIPIWLDLGQTGGISEIEGGHAHTIYLQVS